MSDFSELVNDKSLQAASESDIAVVDLDDGIMTLADDSNNNLPSGFTKSSVSAHKWYSDYTDTSYSTIDNSSKKITVDKSQVNIQQEQNSQFIPFKMARYYDGIDLSEMVITIHFVNAESNDFTSTAVNVCYNASEIRFAWLVDLYATSVAGTLTFEILASGTKGDLTYVWRTQPNDSLTVVQSLTGNNTIAPTRGWESYIALITQSVDDAASSASSAKSSADTATAQAKNAASSATASAKSATESASSATKSANSATASANSATNANTSATNAANSATKSASSASDSAKSATASATSADAAKTSETKAATSADAAYKSEASAAQSATSASVSQAASETAAKESASSAVEALMSQNKAATSEQNANTYATNAKNSQTAAASSATEAATSAKTVTDKIDTVESDMTEEVKEYISDDLQNNYYTKTDLDKIIENLNPVSFSIVGDTLVISTK